MSRLGRDTNYLQSVWKIQIAKSSQSFLEAEFYQAPDELIDIVPPTDIQVVH